MSAIYTVLSRRRGHVTADTAKAGTPTYIVKVRVTILDVFACVALSIRRSGESAVVTGVGKVASCRCFHSQLTLFVFANRPPATLNATGTLSSS